MPNMGYTPFFHYFVKCIPDVSFPIEKKELIRSVGGTPICVSPDKSMDMTEILDKLIPESYSCATALYCALTAIMEKGDLH